MILPPIGLIFHCILQMKKRRISFMPIFQNDVGVSSESHVDGKDPSESNENEMQQLVHRFQCISFFFWFFWAVMQTELGTDWDSKGYAMSRWHLYKELKKQYYGVEALPIVSE